jgi:hypothetical protein
MRSRLLHEIELVRKRGMIILPTQPEAVSPHVDELPITELWRLLWLAVLLWRHVLSIYLFLDAHDGYCHTVP